MNNQYTGIYKVEKFDSSFLSRIESVCSSIREAGYDPYSQLTGFLLTGEDCYITRTGNARTIVSTLDRSELQAYVKTYLENK